MKKKYRIEVRTEEFTCNAEFDDINEAIHYYDTRSTLQVKVYLQHNVQGSFSVHFFEDEKLWKEFAFEHIVQPDVVKIK